MTPLLLALAAAAAPAPAQPPGTETAIVGFAQDGMSDYRIDGDRGAWVRASLDGRWYYLKVRGKCGRLAGANGFGLQLSAGGRLDKYAALTVQGWRCPLDSVTTAQAPPGYGEWKRKRR